MSRKPLRCRRSMLGSVARSYTGPWLIDDRKVSPGVFRRAWHAQFGDRQHQGSAITRQRGVRGRKAAVLARRPLVGCFHEYSYREDTIGDYGVVNGTYTERWLQCDQCGDRQPATWEDAPSYDDYY